MSFSASPLVPGQQSGQDDAWAHAAALVTAAVTAAVAQIPSPTPLTLAEPIGQTSDATLPVPAGAAVTGYIGGGVEGKMLLVVGQELVDALAGTPFGAVEPAQALKPALETVAAGLGAQLDGDTSGIDVEQCLEVLTGGTVVLVPLQTDGVISALVGVSLDVVPAAPDVGGVTAAAGTSPGAVAAGRDRGANWGIDALRDVEMEVTCELGRTRMTVRQLLALAPGEIVELDRLAGAPADLLVNGTLLARGEVVVVDESFGLRITEIVSQDAS